MFTDFDIMLFSISFSRSVASSITARISCPCAFFRPFPALDFGCFLFEDDEDEGDESENDDADEDDDASDAVHDYGDDSLRMMLMRKMWVKTRRVRMMASWRAARNSSSSCEIAQLRVQTMMWMGMLAP
jgi:hypothetical protein